VTEGQCNARGCCFAPMPDTVGGLGAPLSIPSCFLPNAGASAYNLAGGFTPSGAQCARPFFEQADARQLPPPLHPHQQVAPQL